MQYRITKPSRLLNECGELIQKGYATRPILKYNRKNVTRKSRLKEWDYYLIYNDKHAIALTVGKNGSLALISATLIDFINKTDTTKTKVKLVSKKRLSMPLSSTTGDIEYEDRDTKVAFLHENGNRILKLYMKGFLNSDNLNITLKLYHEPKDSMVIATPFEEGKRLFYYNQKIIGMRASGSAQLGEKTLEFLPCDSFGLLDWGRGVWPRNTTWYWSASQGMIDGNLFGFNLGYGFGDTSRATENMLFFNGIASKLDDVTFHIPKNDQNEYEYLEPWNITSSDGRIELIFTPILDRSANLNVLLLSTNQHQVFGTFTGTAVLDDGTIIFLQNFLGFAERVENRW